MFEAIGRKGRTKKLPPTRWVVSTVIMFGLFTGLWLGIDVIQNLPKLNASEAKTEEVSDLKVYKPPPPPPPPPAPVPQSTTKPRKNVITKKVVQKEIDKPTPTPPPPKDQPTPPPEAPAAEDQGSGGSAGGVPGGVIGGVIGGVAGGQVGGIGDVKEVDFGDVEVVKRGPVAYPALAKRNHIESTVVLEVTCSPDGKVVDVRWVEGNKIFEEAVMAAIYQFQYAPQPIAFKFKQPFSFKLKS